MIDVHKFFCEAIYDEKLNRVLKGRHFYNRRL